MGHLTRGSFKWWAKCKVVDYRIAPNMGASRQRRSPTRMGDRVSHPLTMTRQFTAQGGPFLTSQQVSNPDTRSRRVANPLKYNRFARP